MRRIVASFLPWFVPLVFLGVQPLSAQLSTGEGLVVTSSWLSSHLRDPDLVVLEVGPRTEYNKEHIAGSRYVSLNALAVGNQDDGGLTLEMPSPDDLKGRIEALGISDRSTVVVVQAEDWVSPATRILFTLGYAGLSAHSVLLDGGIAAWKRAGFPVTTEVPSITPGHLTTVAIPSLVVDYAYVQSHANAHKVRLVDARDSVFFQGPGRGRMKAGHIPGAVSIPFGTVFDDSSNVLPRAALERIFRGAGIQPGDTVVAYCHVGQQATAVLYAARILGHPVRLYDGSMDDWNTRALPLVGGQP